LARPLPMCPVSGHARAAPTLRVGAFSIPIPGPLPAPSATFRRLAMCYLFPSRAGGRFLPGRCEGKKPTPRQPSVGLYKGGAVWGLGVFPSCPPVLAIGGYITLRGGIPCIHRSLVIGQP
jgi:hypothetical protein